MSARPVSLIRSLQRRTRRLATATMLATALLPIAPAYSQPTTESGLPDPTGPSWCTENGGDVLGSYDGVFACMPLTPGAGADTPYDHDGGDPSGFQCTELANRYLFHRTGIGIFDESLVGGNFVSMAHEAKGLTALKVGNSVSGSLPQAGDIISMWGGTSRYPTRDGDGTHVAIVTAVTPSTTSPGLWVITVLSQNDLASESQTAPPKAGSEVKGDGYNYITVDPDGSSWEYNGGYFTQFDWLELGALSPSAPALKMAAIVKGTGSVFKPLPSGDRISQVTCPAVGTCYAAGNQGALNASVLFSTHNGGASWYTYTSLSPTGTKIWDNSEVVCASRLTCYAPFSDGTSVYIAATSIGGASLPNGALSRGWSLKRLWSTRYGWPTLTCASATVCYAQGEDRLMVTTDGTMTWSQSPVSGIGTLSCPSTTVCFSANGASVVRTIDAGHSWQLVGAPSLAGIFQGEYSFIVCPTILTCYGDNGESTLFWTHNGGSKWTTQALQATGEPISPGYRRFRNIYCPTAQTCYFTYGSQEVYVTSDGGMKWTAWQLPVAAIGAKASPARPQVLQLVGCASASTCFGFDGPNIAMWTRDSGRSWSVQRTDAGGESGGTLWGSCPSTSACYAPASMPPDGLLVLTAGG